MTFYKAPPTLTFGDKYEVLLKEISLGSTFPGAFKIKVENEDKDMNPVFRIEDSIFKGVNDLNQLNTHVITIEWVNEQKDGCEFEYKGKFILNGNRFGFLTDKVSFWQVHMHFKVVFEFYAEHFFKMVFKLQPFKD